MEEQDVDGVSGQKKAAAEQLRRKPVLEEPSPLLGAHRGGMVPVQHFQGREIGRAHV
jgi:hypothetical protein